MTQSRGDSRIDRRPKRRNPSVSVLDDAGLVKADLVDDFLQRHGYRQEAPTRLSLPGTFRLLDTLDEESATFA